MTPPASIAIFRALNLGDMLCIIPTVRAIRGAYPHAKISLIGLPWQAELVRRFSSYFDAFIQFPGWPGLPEQPIDPEQVITFLHDIRRKKFDLVLQMQGNGEITNTMCMLWGAAKVCGLKKKDEYGPPDLFPVSEDDEHEVLRFLKLLGPLAIPEKGTYLEFPILDEDVIAFKNTVQKLLPHDNEFVCLHPGARDLRRRWPVQNFAVLGNALTESGRMVVLTGSSEESGLLDELESLVQGPVINIVKHFGHVKLGTLAVLIREAKLLVSNDTGVSHIAAAVNTRSLIIFSPFSNMTRWAPLDKSLHLAITFDQAKDPAAVLEPLFKFLQESV